MQRVPFSGLMLGGIAIFVVALGSIVLPAHTQSVAPIWLANAIVLALLLRSPSNPSRQVVNVVVYASALLLAELCGRDNWLLAGIFTVANVVEFALAAVLIRRIYPQIPDLTDIRALMTFLFVAAFLAPLVGATIAAEGACVFHAAERGTVWVAWFTSDALGMAIAAPFLLTFDLDDWRELRRQTVQADVLAITLGMSAVVTAATYHRLFLFLGVPGILLISALRLGLVGAAIATFTMTLLGTLLILRTGGYPILEHAPIAQRIMAFQVFMATNVLWALPVAAIHSENKRLLAQVSSEKSRLEGESSHKSQLLSELQRILVRAEERERLRLARELHDETGQAITATMMELKLLEPQVKADKREHVGRIRALLETIARTLHHIAWQLRPTSINDCGLDQALNDYVAYWSSRTQIQIDLHCAVADIDKLDDDLRTAVFRIVQEALTNVAKHADAKMASVVVERVDKVLHIMIEDNGRGFDPADSGATDSGGLGLLGIRERVTLLGGEFQIESSPGGGTTLFARLPLNHGNRA